MLEIKGIAASAGVAIASAFRLEHPDYTVHQENVADSNSELKRLDDALAKSQQELEGIKQRTEEQLGAKKAEIFESHLLILNDPELLDAVRDKITSEKVTAQYALDEVAKQFIDVREYEECLLKRTRCRYERCN